MITTERREHNDAQEGHSGPFISLKVRGGLFEEWQASKDLKDGALPGQGGVAVEQPR